MNDVELFWATIAVPFENFKRGQRVKLPRDRRHATLAAYGYLAYDLITPTIPAPQPTKRGRRKVNDG